MKIAIDFRSLSSGRISGVENYCLNLLENLPLLDQKNQYAFFYNALRRRRLPDFHYVNSEIKQKKIPSKFLNLGLKLNLVKLESLTGPVDWIFMPNLNQFSISPKTKLAITVHDLSPVVTPQFYDTKRRLWHKFLNYKKAFHRANVLFAVSEYTKNDLIKIFKIPAEKIRVIYPGVDHKTFQPSIPVPELRQVRNLYGLPGKFILFLNTIEPRKNLAGLIKAFEKTGGDSWLVIAGRLGWKYSQDFELIKNSRKSAKIKYIGYVNEGHKAALIKLARALVYPSFYEGFGFQPLEAMAVGTPVLVSQLSALPEVVGDAGLLVNPYDENNLAEGLNEILDNDALRQQLIKKGFIRAEKFTWQKTAQEILNNFKS
jgi:glycosyltransferase involved in cell wall biosynthesis